MELSQANVVVIVFVMDGCGACKHYLPRLHRVAEPYRRAGIPILVYDAASADQRVQDLADRFKVTATPTTIVAKRGPGFLRVEGSIADEEIRELMDIASRYTRDA